MSIYKPHNQPERRKRRRFPLNLNAKYAVIGKDLNGAGTTVNISSEGVLIVSPQILPPGTQIQMMIDWPNIARFRTITLQIISGTVIRSKDNQMVVTFSRYEFRPD
jgi:hypothetical protein